MHVWTMLAAAQPLPEISSPLVGTILALLVLVVVQLLLYFLFSRRPAPHEGFVRTGIGGTKVAITTGVLVVPFVQRVTSVTLNPVTIAYRFEGASAPQWHDADRFSGRAFLTLQIPADNPDAVRRAAIAFPDLEDTARVASALEAIVRQTMRDVVRSMRVAVFHQEPAVAEVRLAQALSLVTTGFGITVRAVHLQEGLDDGGDPTSTE